MSACGEQAPPSPSDPPPPSAEDQSAADRVVDAFLEAMADPEVTYRAVGELRVEPDDGEGRAAISVTTRYDVSGHDYAGHAHVSGHALEPPTVGGDFQVVVLDDTAHLYSSNQMATTSVDAPASLRRPDALQSLRADDLVLIGQTDDGHFEFDVLPWIGGDPLGEWADLGAVPGDHLPHTELDSHQSRLLLDEAGVPRRLSTSWSFSVVGESDVVHGTIVDEFAGLGMFVSIAPPENMPVVTSHDVVIGVDAEHVIITEPWREMLPPEGETASVDIVLEWPDEPMMLGIEGAIGFIRSHGQDGRLSMDRIVSLDTDTVDAPVGGQTLVAYYRTCSGNCAILDEPTDFCEVEADIEPGLRYRLTVDILNRDRATCSVDVTD